MGWDLSLTTADSHTTDVIVCPIIPVIPRSSLIVRAVWSNFEIADLDFWRSEPYMKFFEHLDNAGGFYYERWGDAPVHSIGAALLVPKEKLHFFREVGYRHDPFQHCPTDSSHRQGKCWCDEEQDNFGESHRPLMCAATNGFLRDRLSLVFMLTQV